MTTPHDHPRDWWQRPGLEARGGRLLVAGRDAETLAREHGTPLFVYDLTHIEENVRALQGAMARTGLPWRVRWALKSQREPECRARLHALGAPGTPEFVGLDVCSPGEVEYGLAHGFPAAEVSYTGTNVSDRDLDVILERGVHMNLDLISQIHRYGRRDRGGAIGIRINPRVSAARPESGISYYSGDKPTKFGIYPERLDEALAVARSYDLTIDTIHFHVSHHLLDDDLPAFGRDGHGAARDRRRLPAARGQCRRRPRRRHAAGPAATRPRRLRRHPGAAPRPARRDHRLRARRDVLQERRRAARRGGHGGRQEQGRRRQRRLRRPHLRLERHARGIHLQGVRRDGALPSGRCSAHGHLHADQSHQRGPRHLRRGLPSCLLYTSDAAD